MPSSALSATAAGAGFTFFSDATGTVGVVGEVGPSLERRLNRLREPRPRVKELLLAFLSSYAGVTIVDGPSVVEFVSVFARRSRILGDSFLRKTMPSMLLKTEDDDLFRGLDGEGESCDWRAASASRTVWAPEADRLRESGGLRAVLTDASSRVVCDVSDGMTLMEGDEEGLGWDGCGSCTNDLNASPKGVNESPRVSTVGGKMGTTDCLFLRFEPDFASDKRGGGMLSKGRDIS